MTDLAVRAEGLAKRYRIGEQRPAYGTLRDTLAAAPRAVLTRLRGGSRRNEESSIWALDDVSFDVPAGEILGIIGPNGSGKSTLLKILARVTRPTRGRARIQGRVGSLLDVGTGFHPELTGRENIYLSGAVLGMRRREIDRKFDAIVAFAEHEEFLDTPVKRYSSGMYMRLGFSVAAHLDPEILIVDEVLAVGDAAFQKKCLGAMSGVAHDGRTVLFVSHNLVAVEGLCDRVLWLREGRTADEGRPRDVVSHYLAAFSSGTREQVWLDRATAPGSGPVRLRRIAVRPADGSPADPITVRTPILLEFEFWNMADGRTLDVSARLETDRGLVAFDTSPAQDPSWVRAPVPAGLYRVTCRIPPDLLMAGRYRVPFTILADETHFVYHDDGLLTFEIQDDPASRGGWYGETAGVVQPILPWSTERLAGDVGSRRS